MNTLYDRLGGPNQVSRIMEDFQRRTWQDPQLRVFFQDQRHSFFKIHQWNLVKLALTVWEEEEDENKAESSSSNNNDNDSSSSSNSSKSTATASTTTAMDEQLAILFARHAKLFAPLPEEENKTKQESFNNNNKAMAVIKKGQAHPLEMMEQHTESETESDESSELSVVRQQSQQTPIILGVEACDAMLLHLIHSLQANRVPQYITDRAIVTLAKVRDVFVQGNRYQPKVDLTKTTAAKPKPKMSLLVEDEEEEESAAAASTVEPSSAAAVRTSPRPRLVRSLSCDLSPQSSKSSLQSQQRRRLKSRPSLLRKSSACDLTHDDNDDNDDDDNHIIVAAAIAESRRRRGRPNDDHLRDRGIPLTISTGNRRASLLKSQSTFFRKSVRVLTKAL